MPLPASAPRPFLVPVTGPNPSATVVHGAPLPGQAGEFPGTADAPLAEPRGAEPPDLVVADLDPTTEELLRWCRELRVRGDGVIAAARQVVAATADLVERMRDERRKRQGTWSTPNPE